MYGSVFRPCRQSFSYQSFGKLILFEKFFRWLPFLFRAILKRSLFYFHIPHSAPQLSHSTPRHATASAPPISAIQSARNHNSAAPFSSIDRNRPWYDDLTVDLHSNPTSINLFLPDAQNPTELVQTDDTPPQAHSTVETSTYMEFLISFST